MNRIQLICLTSAAALPTSCSGQDGRPNSGGYRAFTTDLQRLPGRSRILCPQLLPVCIVRLPMTHGQWIINDRWMSLLTFCDSQSVTNDYSNGISRNISSDIYENYNTLAPQAKNLRFWCAIESGKKNLPVNIPTVYLILNTKSYENNSSYPKNFSLRRAYFLTFSTQNPYFLKSTHFPLKSLKSTHLLDPPIPHRGGI